MKRLLYISESILPSAQANSIQVTEMCSAFAAEGVEVLLHGYRNPDAAAVSVADFYGMVPAFRVEMFGVLSRRTGQWLNAFHSVLTAWRFKPDLVYTRHLRACMLAVKLGFPVVVELHGMPRAGSRIARHILPRILSSPALLGVVCITRALRDDFCEVFGYPADRVMIAHDGACAAKDIKTIGSRRRPVVGYAGQLYPGKGMEVITALAKRCPWADFWVIGGSPDDVDYWKAKAGVVANLRFTGWVRPSRVRRYVSKFDIALLPNQRKVASSGGDDIARYTSPLKLFEYMAAARPILASDLEVLREVLRHGENALLCDPDRLEMWETALKKLHDDPESARRLGRTARADLVREYTWSARAKGILSWVRGRRRFAK